MHANKERHVDMQTYPSPLLQFGKGVLDMARVFDRQVSVTSSPLPHFPFPLLFFFLPSSPFLACLFHPPASSCSCALECRVLARREKEADAQEATYMPPRETGPHQGLGLLVLRCPPLPWETAHQGLGLPCHDVCLCPGTLRPRSAPRFTGPALKYNL